MTKEKIKVNLVELCSDLANFPTDALEKGSGEAFEYYDEDEECFKYTERGQQIFDKYYNEIWNYLESQGFENI